MFCSNIFMQSTSNKNVSFLGRILPFFSIIALKITGQYIEMYKNLIFRISQDQRMKVSTNVCRCESNRPQSLPRPPCPWVTPILKDGRELLPNWLLFCLLFINDGSIFSRYAKLIDHLFCMWNRVVYHVQFLI